MVTGRPFLYARPELNRRDNAVMAKRTTKVTLALIWGIAALPLLAACGGSSPRHGSGAMPAPPSLRPPPVSLAGEVLDATPDVACWPATEAWFKAVDSNGNGQLEPVELQADTKRFFGTIDTNRDGALTATEVGYYREQVAPNAYRDRPAAQGLRNSAAASPMTADRPPSPVDGTPPPGAGRTPPRDSGLRAQPDPVMAADTNLDFRVTLDEMIGRVTNRADKLDTNRDGNLDSTELAAYCPPE